MLEFFKKRRTIRKYTDQEVEKEKVDKLVQAALTAPSGRNAKPVELIVIEDRKMLDKLAESRGTPSKWLAGAPLGMVLVFDPEISTTGLSDAAIMATIIQLQAKYLELGSCWIHVEGRETAEGENLEEAIKEILDIPEKYRIN